MRKRDKLYTVNKYNKRLFDTGGPLYQPTGYDPAGMFYNNTGGYKPAFNVQPLSAQPLNNSKASNPFEGNPFESLSAPKQQISGLDPKDLKPLEEAPAPKSKPSSGLFGGMSGAGIMGAASSIGDIPTGDPRGMWDTADPVYHLAGGRETGAGNVMSDAGVGLTKAGLQSGQPWLAVAGAGLKVVGGLVNAMFGVKENKENTNFVRTNTTNAMNMGNQLASASSNEELGARAGKMVGSSGFNWNDLYENGWFTSKGTRLGNNLLNKEKTALAIQRHGLNTGAKNIDSMMDENVMRHFAAFGGPLEQMAMTPGAIGYGFMSDYLNNKRQQVEANDTMTNSFAGAPSDMFAEGGNIHIKPSHRGRLTELKERTGKSEAELYNDGNPAHKKMVVFARNARKWNHAEGGPLFAFGGDMETNIADFPTGSTHIDAGGSHEQNPYDGVQMGVDKQGVPNLVEEGEVVFDDYVYSNRIPCDETTKQKFHVGKKKDITYADLAKKLEKEIAERPNDAISQAGFSAQMHDLAEQQERQKQEIEAQRAREAFEALSPEEKLAVMQQAAQQEQAAQQAAIQQQAMQEQAMVEQQPSPEEAAIMEQQMQPDMHAEGGNLYAPGGEISPYAYDTNWDNFAYFNPETGEYDKGYLDFVNGINQAWVDRLMKGEFGELSRYAAKNKGVNPTVAQVIKLASDKKYSDMHKAMANAYDAYRKEAELAASSAPTPVETEAVVTPVVTPAPVVAPEIVPTPASISAPVAVEVKGKVPEETTPKFKKKNENLRYAGLFGPATGLTMMAAGVGKPDYTYFENAVASLNNPAMATYTPLGDYLRYTPMDIWAEQNKMNANARATDRVIANSSNPAKMAGLLANSYNTQLASGDLYRKALEYNDAKRAQVADFNRATNLQNSQMGSHTSQFNAEAINRNAQHQAALAMQAAKERLDSDASWYNSLYGNMNSLYKGLSEVGRENAEANWRNALAASGVFGNLNEDILKQLGAKRAKGGCIKKRKNGRRGLTY